MSKPLGEQHATPASEEAVLEFLYRRPDFLLDKPDLLARLELPHHAGEGTISLVERQVNILRERNISMRHRLSNLLDIARRNDDLFEKTRRLTLRLLETKTAAQLVDALLTSFEQDFKVETSRLIFNSQSFQPSAFTGSEKLQKLHCLGDKDWQALGALTPSNRILTGSLPEENKQLVFDKSANKIGSAALVPLANDSEIIGYIALGNQDKHYYQASTDTLFLAHIAELFSVISEQHKLS